MKIIQINRGLKSIIWVFLFVMVSSLSFGLTMGNYSENAYCNDCENKSEITNLVIDGGANFLKGYSDILQLLNRVELSSVQGSDFKEQQAIVADAIDSMNKAQSAYSALVETAGVTPYDIDTLMKLSLFDYDAFLKETNLNNDVFQDVVSYLRKGDIKGFYARLLEQTKGIVKQLAAIKASVDAGVFPELSTLWALNNTCSTTLLFGQYAAEIFSNIK